MDSRPHCGTIKRRRECSDCGHRYTTYEMPEELLAKRSLEKVISELSPAELIAIVVHAAKERDNSMRKPIIKIINDLIKEKQCQLQSTPTNKLETE